ncbi:MAG: cupin domain-containing protein [Anaerolineae bacterium]|nr:cupin domain-containing protein [Anaerolineae bacterium]
MQKVNLEEKYQLFSDQWSPKEIAQVNDHLVKVAKVQGEYFWHSHEDVDELFLVHKGELRIQFRDGEVILRAGELLVVPRGVEHCPVAEEEVELILIEPGSIDSAGREKRGYSIEDETI